MAFRRNKVKVDLASYPPYFFLAPRKFGKTTWWNNLVVEAWGDESKGLLISCGQEEGYHALDDINYDVAKVWSQEYDEEDDSRGLVQIVDDLIENNKEYGIKGVCFDTLDTFVDIATTEVLRLHKIEKKTPCKSLNDAFGGFRRGVDRLLEIMDEQIDRLRDAGFAVFILCHTKLKEKTDILSGEKYEQLTNNLQDGIFGHFADKSQMVMIGAIDREINNGKVVSEERLIHLRGNSLIDAGSRFEELPETITLNPRDFLDTFEAAVKGQMKKPATDAQIKKMKKEEAAAQEKKAEQSLKKQQAAREFDEDRNLELIATIKDNLGLADEEAKEEIKKVMAEYGIKNFKTTNISTEGLQKIVDILI